MYIYIHIYTYVHMCVYIHVYIYTCIHKLHPTPYRLANNSSLCVFIEQTKQNPPRNASVSRASSFALPYRRASYVCMYLYTYICIYVYVYMCVYVYV